MPQPQLWGLMETNTYLPVQELEEHSEVDGTAWEPASRTEFDVARFSCGNECAANMFRVRDVIESVEDEEFCRPGRWRLFGPIIEQCIAGLQHGVDRFGLPFDRNLDWLESSLTQDVSPITRFNESLRGSFQSKSRRFWVISDTAAWSPSSRSPLWDA